VTAACTVVVVVVVVEVVVGGVGAAVAPGGNGVGCGVGTVVVDGVGAGEALVAPGTVVIGEPTSVHGVFQDVPGCAKQPSSAFFSWQFEPQIAPPSHHPHAASA